MENLFDNQELPKLVINSFILVTLMFDSGVILQGEIGDNYSKGFKEWCTETKLVE